jgi:signal transduction histidine kinase
MPGALDQALYGLGRVATLVRSMKEFAHADQRDKAPSDINRALTATLSITRNEYKYIADVRTHLGDLPLVVCHLSELNQCFLNLIVNASHAIADAVDGTDRRGVIEIRTHVEAGTLVVSISDTGTGIPLAIRDKIFDPFFTTKTLGRGTGQGLAIARNVIVDKHDGSLTFETELGRGTTFYVRLPVNGDAELQVTAA